MSTKPSFPAVQPYLNFNGRCAEAIEFYRGVLGAEVDMLMHFKDAPAGNQCPGSDGDKIMHASFHVGETVVMASDCESTGKPEFKGFSLSYAVSTEADAERVFNALAAGGQVHMPLEKTFWSPRFGVVADKFGVSWMVNVVVPE